MSLSSRHTSIYLGLFQGFEAAYRVNFITNQLHGQGMPGELLHSRIFVYYEVFLISKINRKSQTSWALNVGENNLKSLNIPSRSSMWFVSCVWAHSSLCLHCHRSGHQNGPSSVGPQERTCIIMSLNLESWRHSHFRNPCLQYVHMNLHTCCSFSFLQSWKIMRV